jgi:hypothetical protein
MDSSGNRAILVIFGAVAVLAALVALIGYPLLILTAVLAAFVALVAIVVLSAGDMWDKPSQKKTSPSHSGRLAAARS